MQALFVLLSTVVNRSGRDEQDAALIDRISRGEESALSELYDKYAQVLYSFAMRILRSVAEAEDTVQEIFLKVWNNADSYEPAKGAVYTWLVTMMRNRAIDRMRSKGFKQHSSVVDVNSLLLVVDSKSPNPHSRMVQDEHQQLVIGTLKQLSIDQQQVLALAYYEGFSQSEIAQKLNIPLGTVKSRMRKGLQLMRSKLQDKM